MPEGYFSTAQLLSRYGDISRRTLLYWRETRGFPQPAFTARTALYARDAVFEWERENFNFCGLELKEKAA